MRWIHIFLQLVFKWDLFLSLSLVFLIWFLLTNTCSFLISVLLEYSKPMSVYYFHIYFLILLSVFGWLQIRLYQCLVVNSGGREQPLSVTIITTEYSGNRISIVGVIHQPRGCYWFREEIKRKPPKPPTLRSTRKRLKCSYRIWSRFGTKADLAFCSSIHSHSSQQLAIYIWLLLFVLLTHKIFNNSLCVTNYVMSSGCIFFLLRDVFRTRNSVHIYAYTHMYFVCVCACVRWKPEDRNDNEHH